MTSKANTIDNESKEGAVTTSQMISKLEAEGASFSTSQKLGGKVYNLHIHGRIRGCGFVRRDLVQWAYDCLRKGWL